MLYGSRLSVRWLTLCLVLINANVAVLCQSNFTISKEKCDEKHNEILSRRKRFIIFPEGSSLQLVFCVAYPTIFTIGDIFLFGYTVALAWELPQDPYSPYRHHADPIHRRTDSKNVYYTDYDGKVLFKKPYKRKPIVNPAFAKRSADENVPATSDTYVGGKSLLPLKQGHEFEMDRKRMHSAQLAREYLKGRTNGQSDFHRMSRVQLYGKIESFLKALGVDGRQCMLNLLCQVGQSRNAPQGTFLEEIMTAVLTLPKGREFEDEYHRDYDAAHSATKPCNVLYPCEHFIKDPVNNLFTS